MSDVGDIEGVEASAGATISFLETRVDVVDRAGEPTAWTPLRYWVEDGRSPAERIAKPVRNADDPGIATRTPSTRGGDREWHNVSLSMAAALTEGGGVHWAIGGER